MTSIRHPLQSELAQAAYYGDEKCFWALVERGANPAGNHSEPLRRAALGGQARLMERLIPLCDPAALQGAALREAAQAGSLECVELLLPFCAEPAHRFEALLAAARQGRPECARLLLPLCECPNDQFEALRAACLNDGPGQRECVAVILSLAPPKPALVSSLLSLARRQGLGCAGPLLSHLEALSLADEPLPSEGSGARARPRL